jgi:ABC-type Zn uptake system ZnuABC Zn-binding protein ZnuA
MKRIGSVELKPGIEPTPNHIVELTQQIKQEKAQLLIYGAQNPRIPRQISNETGIKPCACTAAVAASRKPIPISNGSISPYAP